MYGSKVACSGSLVVVLTLLGCDPPGGQPSQTGEQKSAEQSAVASPAFEPASASSPGSTTTDQPPRVVFLGDSLTAGLGLPEHAAFPQRIEQELSERGVEIKVINAGVSGDTSAGGLSRIDWILRQQPDIVVVCLGANDGLRGLSSAMTRRNLNAILDKILEARALPVLLGMKLPPNLGPEYVTRFESIYPTLAIEFEIPLVPFLLEGVAGVASLNLPDGIHPNAAGHRQLAANVLPTIKKVLDKLDSE